MQMSGGPTGRNFNIAKWFGVGLASLVFVFGFWAYATHQHTEFFDSALASRANSVCASTKAELRTATPLPPSPSFGQRARQVELLNGSVARMVQRLRDLERQGVSSSFDRWLDDWNEFTAVGVDYAEALRSGDPALYEAAGNRGDIPSPPN
jgi:hypothetical protein